MLSVSFRQSKLPAFSCRSALLEACAVCGVRLIGVLFEPSHGVRLVTRSLTVDVHEPLQ